MFLNCRRGLKQDHIDRSIILASSRVRWVAVPQPFLRQISNRALIIREADCVTYTLSMLSANPSSYNFEI